MNGASHQGVQAFSLLELMMSLAVMAMLLMLTIHPWLNPLAQHRQTSPTLQLARDLRHARHLAVSSGVTVTVCPSRRQRVCDPTNLWHHGWLMFYDPDRQGQPDHPDRIIALTSLEPVIEMYSGGRQRIRFTPQGHAYGSNLTVRSCSPAHTMTSWDVVVSNSGRIRLVSQRETLPCPLLIAP